jgi:hypothetical protein
MHKKTLPDAATSESVSGVVAEFFRIPILTINAAKI